MQSVGFAYALAPALERLYGRGDAYRVALGRHLEFFNTHPYFAAVLLGCAARLEADGQGEAVGRVKAALMGPFGALGDSLYWGALKPLLVLLALHGAYQGVAWAPWALVAVYGAANLGGRALGFWQGYRRGPGVIEWMGGLGILAWVRRLKGACALLAGTLLALAAGPTSLDRWGVPVLLWVPGAWVLVLAGAWILGQGVRPVWLVASAAVISSLLVAVT